MKFGKLCEEAFRKLEIDLPAFPYKQAKKEMKAAALQPCGLAARVVFFNFLRKELKLIDAKWSCAARQTVQSKVAPITTTFLTTLGLRRRQGAEAARKLNAWASLSRDSVRKIVKKYNKQLGPRCGHVAEPPGTPPRFVRSRLRTELEILVQQEEAMEDGNSAALDCPVCLETLFDPVAPECGHALCRECFLALCQRCDILQCPICRRPATNTRRACQHAEQWPWRRIQRRTPLGSVPQSKRSSRTWPSSLRTRSGSTLCMAPTRSPIFGGAPHTAQIGPCVVLTAMTLPISLPTKARSMNKAT